MAWIGMAALTLGAVVLFLAMIGASLVARAADSFFSDESSHDMDPGCGEKG
jgi:hypothetical protein